MVAEEVAQRNPVKTALIYIPNRTSASITGEYKVRDGEPRYVLIGLRVCHLDIAEGTGPQLIHSLSYTLYVFEHTLITYCHNGYREPLQRQGWREFLSIFLPS